MIESLRGGEEMFATGSGTNKQEQFLYVIRAEISVIL